MDTLTDLLIGIGLSMDSAAVAIVWGSASRKTFEPAVSAGLCFGAVQALLLAIGGLGGEALKASIESIDHWIAFGLLGFVGARMIITSLRGTGKGAPAPSGMAGVVVLALATSIDALAAGAGLAFADNSIVQTIIIVAAVTAALSFAGVYAGRYGGRNLGARIGIFGGCLLIVIGLRILLSHYGI